MKALFIVGTVEVMNGRVTHRQKLGRYKEGRR